MSEVKVKVLDEDKTAVGVRYLVSIDKQDLGSFSSCEGLGVEVVIESREEGGFNTGVWQLPTRLKYPNIKLSRPLGEDTGKIAAWLAQVSRGLVVTTATIAAQSTSGEPIATWNLQGVVPVRWTGPSLTAESPKVVTETLELAHHGFHDGAGW